MHKPSSIRDYIIALLIGSSLTVFFSLYLFIRRGYLFDTPPTADTLFVFNKILAGAGAVLLALTFLVGPVVRYFDRFDKWLGYRKEIGIVAGFMIIAHALISYFFLPLKFPQSSFDLSSLPFASGIVGALLLVFLFVISFKKAISVIGATRWWFLQRWGLRIVIVFTLAHVSIMKWESWMRWLTKSSQPTTELTYPLMPGLGILVMLFFTWVVIIRVYESVFIFKDFGLSTKEIALDPALKAHGRRFFVASFWILVILYSIVATRWIG